MAEVYRGTLLASSFFIPYKFSFFDIISNMADISSFLVTKFFAERYSLTLIQQAQRRREIEQADEDACLDFPPLLGHFSSVDAKEGWMLCLNE